MNPLVHCFSGHQTNLSVNLNKVAWLRNARHGDNPSLLRAATLVLEAGAHGLTIHPRPDQRHVRPQDVDDLSRLLKSWPHAELNIEGNPFHQLLPLVRRLVHRGWPLHQCTLVPDGESQLTSDHGWDLSEDGSRLAPVIEELKLFGLRVSLFLDPKPKAMAKAKALGVDRVELYTESYAKSHGSPKQGPVLKTYMVAAQAAQELGLGVNAGHDLNRQNLTDFLCAVPGVDEVSIGHALISDGLELGLGPSVREYLLCIHRAQAV